MSFKEKTEEELAEWLEQGGVPETVSLAFKENKIDGETFLELSEDDVKSLVKPLGVVKKILRLQKPLLPQLSGGPTAFLFPSPPPLDRSRAASPLSPTNSLGSVRSPAHDTMSVSSAASLGRSLELKDRKFEIPDLWRPSVMDCIQEQRLTPEARNEIVRDLVTHMYGFIEKPTGQFCKEVAKMLVEKYPFMADSGSTPSDLKSGSWQQKLLDRVYNIEKGRKRKRSTTDDDSTPTKRGRPKKITSLEYRYPPTHDNSAQDPTVEKRNLEALSKETEKSKPRKEIVLPLMKSCFFSRRQYVMNDAQSVTDILGKYPALKMPSVIDQEMEQVLNKTNMFQAFSAEWRNKWVPAILEYCRQSKRKDVKETIRNAENSGEEDQEEEQKLAIRLLCCLFSTHAKKAVSETQGDLLRFIYEKYQMTTTPEQAAAEPPARNTPRIAEFEVDDGTPNYFIFVEQSVLCPASSFCKAVFYWFSAHYVFNLEYSKNLKEFGLFFQEFVFGLPGNCKKTATYLVVTTDIQKLTIS